MDESAVNGWRQPGSTFRDQGEFVQTKSLLRVFPDRGHEALMSSFIPADADAALCTP